MMVSGALMGFTPQQVKAMSIHDFSTIVQGYSEAHGGKKRAKSMSQDDLAALGIEGA